MSMEILLAMHIKKKTELCIIIPSSNFISEQLHNNIKQGKMQPYSLWVGLFWFRRENNKMNELKDLMKTQRNYYALLISILTKETAKESLMDMGIAPDGEEE